MLIGGGDFVFAALGPLAPPDLELGVVWDILNVQVVLGEDLLAILEPLDLGTRLTDDIDVQEDCSAHHHRRVLQVGPVNPGSHCNAQQRVSLMSPCAQEIP